MTPALAVPTDPPILSLRPASLISPHLPEALSSPRSFIWTEAVSFPLSVWERDWGQLCPFLGLLRLRCPDPPRGEAGPGQKPGWPPGSQEREGAALEPAPTGPVHCCARGRCSPPPERGTGGGAGAWAGSSTFESASGLGGGGACQAAVQNAPERLRGTPALTPSAPSPILETLPLPLRG